MKKSVTECVTCNRMIKNGHWNKLPDGFGTDCKNHKGPGMPDFLPICAAHRHEHLKPLNPAHYQ